MTNEELYQQAKDEYAQKRGYKDHIDMSIGIDRDPSATWWEIIDNTAILSIQKAREEALSVLNAQAFDHLSYHDVVVTVNGTDYKISDNYAYLLECCRVSGWQLWFRWDRDVRMIGGEYNYDDFKITVGGRVILDVRDKDKPREE